MHCCVRVSYLSCCLTMEYAIHPENSAKGHFCFYGCSVAALRPQTQGQHASSAPLASCMVRAGMVVTRRVPSPRSVRHLLQVASVSASVVGKRVRQAWTERVLACVAAARALLTAVCWRGPTLYTHRKMVHRPKRLGPTGRPAPSRNPLSFQVDHLGVARYPHP